MPAGARGAVAGAGEPTIAGGAAGGEGDPTVTEGAACGAVAVELGAITGGAAAGGG